MITLKNSNWLEKGVFFFLLFSRNCYMFNDLYKYHQYYCILFILCIHICMRERVRERERCRERERARERDRDECVAIYMYVDRWIDR